MYNSRIEGKIRRGSRAAKRPNICIFVLAGATLMGRELLELPGINQDAFSVVGGLIIDGPLLATLGAQIMPGGLKSFFSWAWASSWLLHTQDGEHGFPDLGGSRRDGVTGAVQRGAVDRRRPVIPGKVARRCGS